MEIIKSSLSAAEPSLKDRVVNPGATFGPSNIKQLSQEISRDPVKFSELQEAVAELSAKQAEQSPEERSPSETVKLGVCEYLVGDYDAAVQTLAEKNDGDALNPFYRAKIALRLGRNEDAIACFNKAEKAGYPKGDCALGRAEAYRALGKSIESVNELDSISGETEQTVEYFYQRGATTADLITNPDDGYTKTPEEMINWYERAYEADRNNPGALFGMALENERRGNDDEALALYQRLVCLNPTYVGALINLGLLYEDRENYEEAVNCYKRVLDTDPTNVKAQMYIKDAEASLNRGRSTGRQRYTSAAKSIYDKQVSDYELSARARKALQTMGIETLGDLCSHTEKELLATKNFGDSSLDEIKRILDDAGLRLGTGPQHDEADLGFDADAAEAGADSLLGDSVLSKSVDELNLTVRAKKCLSRKDIRTIGELVRTTAEDLMSSKNFGVTSLNEIKKKLNDLFGLKLKGE
ncbi:MAG: tetratricopeptide repeat protein [Thermoguttaceae bacterium]|nr:tetratricopeptide repeat protein [Thermoguttaceae bacterium]MBR5415681.1 tetratricopeptide repeat protein [Thermoguttaceae bacterium]